MEKIIKVVFKRSVFKDFKKIPREYQIAINKKISELQKDPLLGKQLAGSLKHIRRLRVGLYRIAYHYDGDKLIVLILKIGSRGKFYEELSRLIM